MLISTVRIFEEKITIDEYLFSDNIYKDNIYLLTLCTRLEYNVNHIGVLQVQRIN